MSQGSVSPVKAGWLSSTDVSEGESLQSVGMLYQCWWLQTLPRRFSINEDLSKSRSMREDVKLMYIMTDYLLWRMISGQYVGYFILH